MGSAGNPDIDGWDDALREAVKASLHTKSLYCRIYPHRPYAGADALALRGGGWSRSRHPLFTGLSLMLDLDRSTDIMRAGLSRNLRRGWSELSANPQEAQRREFR